MQVCLTSRTGVFPQKVKVYVVSFREGEESCRERIIRSYVFALALLHLLSLFSFILYSPTAAHRTISVDDAIGLLKRKGFDPNICMDSVTAAADEAGIIDVQSVLESGDNNLLQRVFADGEFRDNDQHY